MRFEENAQIKKLESDLYFAKRTIINLMPKTFQEILTDLTFCRTRDDLIKSETEAIERIIELTKPFESTGILPKRGNCPLCHRGADSPYTDGFALPEGLFRHLSGQGNAHRCAVFQAAHDLAFDRNKENFDEHDHKVQKEKEAHKAQRKKTETLYTIEPNRDSLLIDENLFGNVRGAEELSWAENRLNLLGFEMQCERNKKAFIKESEDFIVYADLRSQGNLRFYVFEKLSLSKKRNSYESFNFPDSWKHTLQDKFNTRYNQAVLNLKRAKSFQIEW